MKVKSSLSELGRNKYELNPIDAKQIEEIQTHTAYRTFINSLKSPHTKIQYRDILFRYLMLPINKNLSLDEILSKDPKVIEYEISELIMQMKDERNLSFSSLNVFFSSIAHFYEMNDVVINKRKIKKFMGENTTKYEYKSYTIDMISKILNVADDRGKAIILLMASTGMRVGALEDLKLKHLKRWVIDSQGNYVYQITVYANSKKSKYQTFCTPEAAKAIDNYMLLRKRYGENIKQDAQTGNWLPSESFLFVSQFNKDANTIITNPKRIQRRAFNKYVVSLLEKTGQRQRYRLTESESYYESMNDGEKYLKVKSEVGQHRNEIHPCHSFRIFTITNMIRAKINDIIREMLVGHSTGLDGVYYKPTDDEILQEYLKAVDLLTINNEHRLQKQVDYYKERSDRLAEMSDRVRKLEEKWGI